MLIEFLLCGWSVAKDSSKCTTDDIYSIATIVVQFFVVVVALLLLFSFVCRTYVYILNLKERRADQCECRFSVYVCVRTFI